MLLRCLRAAVTAAADIKRKDEEVKVKFGVGHFKLQNDNVHCQHCEAVYTYNTTTTSVMHDFNNITLR